MSKFEIITIIGKEIDNKTWTELFSHNHLVDAGIKLIKCNITADILSLKDRTVSLSIDKCTFHNRLQICDLLNGTYISIKDCISKTPFARISLERIYCGSFEYIEKINHKETCKNDEIYLRNKLMVDFTECGFDYFSSNSSLTHQLSNVQFRKKFKLKNYNTGPDEDHLVRFEKCSFIDYLELIVDIKLPVILIISECETIASNDESPNVNLYPLKSKFISIEIADSAMYGFNFNFFKTDIGDIEIKNSEIGSLEIYTIEKDTSLNKIYNLNIENSTLSKLLANNRYFMHPILLNECTLINPPQFYGCNIPEGSEFPSRTKFINRKGLKDASCYRTLRFAMESQRNRELEGMFFTLEQESILNNESFIRKHLSTRYFYGIISDYGTNHIKPLVILTASNTIFAITYSYITSHEISLSLPINWELLKTSFLFSIKQSLIPFSHLRETVHLPIEATFTNSLLLVLSIIQSIISVSCLGLSLLAIRWKFKRG